MERDPESYNVRAVERAMQILSSFDGEHPERGVSEIAQATGLHKATAHRVGIRAVSAPIWDIDGNVIAALSMPGPTNRMAPKRIPEIAEALVETAKAVSAHVWRE